jgi:hypothetical protein
VNPSQFWYSLLMEGIHPEDRLSFEEILNRAVRDKSEFEYEYRIVPPEVSKECGSSPD